MNGQQTITHKEQTKKLLIVDDDIDILEGMTFILSSEGYDVKTLSKGEDVPGTLETYHPNVILLDVLMSGSDGREICKEIKKSAAHKHIPVIMISAHPSAKKNALECGAEEFIAKPFEIDDLLKSVKRLAK